MCFYCASNFTDGAATNDVISLNTRRAVAIWLKQVSFLYRDAAIDAADKRTDRRDIHIVRFSPVVVPRHKHAIDFFAASGVTNLGLWQTLITFTQPDTQFVDWLHDRAAQNIWFAAVSINNP